MQNIRRPRPCAERTTTNGFMILPAVCGSTTSAAARVQGAIVAHALQTRTDGSQYCSAVVRSRNSAAATTAVNGFTPPRDRLFARDDYLSLTSVSLPLRYNLYTNVNTGLNNVCSYSYLVDVIGWGGGCCFRVVFIFILYTECPGNI